MQGSACAAEVPAGLPQTELQTFCLQLQVKRLSRGRMLLARQSLRMDGNGSHIP